MKILINEGLSTLNKLTGIGVVATNLHKHLQKITKCDITNYSYLRRFPRILRRGLYLSIVNAENYLQKYDIIHYLNYYVPKPHKNIRQVTTIHDLTYYKFPETLPKNYLVYISKAIESSIERANLVIAPSESVRIEILEKFKSINDNRVKVCLNGVSDIFFQNINLQRSSLQDYKLNGEDYFLYIGTIEKRKNLLFLIESVLEAQKQKQIKTETKLILVGKAGYGFGEISKYLSQQNIIWLDHVPEYKLLPLYKFSKALILPSLYEGFGIPVAEAMIIGIPIIASNIPTNIEFNERHNKQMLIFELGNQKQLIDLLHYIDEGSSELKKLNYGDTSIYSYDNVAINHFEIYKSVINS